MKTASIVLASLLASSALAQPHRHQARHNKKRDDVVWVTETDYVTDVIGVTTTIWVSSGFVPPTTSTSTSAIPTSSSTEAQFFEAPSSSSTPSATSSAYVPPAPVASSSSSVYVAPVAPSSSVYVAPVEETPTSTPTPTVAATSTTPVYVAPVQSSSSSSPAEVYAPESVTTSTPEPSTTSTSVPAYTPPVEATSSTSAVDAIATAVTALKTLTGSVTGTCLASDQACQGDITYYEAGLGACGSTTDGSAENVVALPHEFMGTQSNGNPYCGKTITITEISTGKSTTALVVDKCMGCTGRSIDLSTKAFAELDPNYETVGRTTAVWYFND